MKLRNHYKMGNIIYYRLCDNGVFLQRFWFLLGNLTPDICMSFVFSRHEYEASLSYIKKLMRHLYEGRFHPRSAAFSFCLGLINHYICDYFCYSHHPSFHGNLWEHIVYEARQKTEFNSIRLFLVHKDREMSFSDLTIYLDRSLINHDLIRSRNNGKAYSDIPPAVSAAARLNSVLCLRAERARAAPRPCYAAPCVYPRAATPTFGL